MRFKKGISTILVLSFLLLGFLSYFDPLLIWDENAYLGNARDHIDQSNYTEDFRYPLLEFLVGGLWQITGENIFLARLMMIMFYMATIYLFYEISKTYFKKNTLLTALFAFSSLMVYWGFRIYTDVLVVFFILLSFYLLNKKGKYWVFISGIAASLAFLTKFTSVLFIAAVGIHLLLKKEIRNAFLFSSGVLLGLAPWMLYNYFSYSNIFWDFFAQLDLATRYNVFMSPVGFIKDLVIHTHIFFIMMLINIKNILKKKNMRLMLIYVSLYIIYIAFVSDVKFARYIPSVIPFIYILGWSKIDSIKKSINRNILIVLTILITIILLVGALININHQFDCDKNGGISKTIDYLKNEKEVDVVSNVWPWFGYYNNFKMHSFYASIEELISSHNPKYFIYNKISGEQFNESMLNEKLTIEKTFEGKCGEITYIYNTSRVIR